MALKLVSQLKNSVCCYFIINNSVYVLKKGPSLTDIPHSRQKETFGVTRNHSVRAGRASPGQSGAVRVGWAMAVARPNRSHCSQGVTSQG